MTGRARVVHFRWTGYASCRDYFPRIATKASGIVAAAVRTSAASHVGETEVWRIGGLDGLAPELLDDFAAPTLGEVLWRVGYPDQRWPAYHPSEADPLGGYREHPRRIAFDLAAEPAGTYVLAIDYFTICPRLPHLEVRIAGESGRALLKPVPSRSGEVLVHAGLHSAIYSEGSVEVAIPARLLCRGENVVELVCRDEAEVLRVEDRAAVERLDRMANGAGIYYRRLRLLKGTKPDRSGATPGLPLRRVTLEPTVLYRRGSAGDLSCRCLVDVELLDGCEATPLLLHLKDATSERTVPLELPATDFGHRRLAFDLWDGEGEVSYAVQTEGVGKPPLANGTFRRRRKWRVYVAAHAHTDIGYTHRQWEVAERNAWNVDTALARIGAAPDEPFAYHFDAFWVLTEYLPGRDAATRERLMAAVAAGRIGFAATYADVLTHAAALEDLIRNLEPAHDLLRRHGLRAELAAAVDVASLTGALPDVLAGAGVRYLVHANNQDRGPLRLNGDLHLLSPFRWRGVAGGEVLTWLSRMYGELRKVCGSPPTLGSAERGLALWLDEFERDDYAPDSVLLYGQEADNTDLDPQPEAFVRAWNEAHAYPRFVVADPAEFFRDVETRYGDELPEVRGDGGAYWEDGVGSSFEATALARTAQATLPAAERLEALAVLHGEGLAFPLDRFDAAWRELLLFDEHTWGAYCSATDPEALITGEQWDVKRGFVGAAERWSRRLLQAAAAKHALSWAADDREVAVFNPNSWAFGGRVVVETAVGERVVDETGAAVPARVLDRGATQQRSELWIDDVPGLGYRRFRLERDAGPRDEPARATRAARDDSSHRDGLPPEGQDDGLVQLENDWYRLTFDRASGQVVSLFDKALGRELLEAGAPWALGQLVHASGGEGTRLVSNRSTLPPGDPELAGELTVTGLDRTSSALGEHLAVMGESPAGPVRVEWTLPARAKRVDVSYTLRKPAQDGKEALYVAFPFDLPGARVLSDGHVGWTDWRGDLLPGGCSEWLPVQSAIHLRGDAAHVLVASPQVPLFTVGDVVRGRWPRRPELRGSRVYSYVLNNYWHTNYPGVQEGELTFAYAITSAHSLTPAGAYRFGWQARRPLLATRLSRQDFREARAPYDDPTGGRLAEAGGEDVVLTTLKGARHAAGLVARFQEVAGAPAGGSAAVLRFPGRRIARALRTDLLERDLQELPVDPDGSLRVSLPAWSLLTVRVELEDSDVAVLPPGGQA